MKTSLVLSLISCLQTRSTTSQFRALKAGGAEWRHKNSDQYFEASALSDGTLRFIALATLFLQPEEYRPSLILVDEPELGVEMLASLMKQTSVTTQVMCPLNHLLGIASQREC
jgi:hypothetical protein